MKQYKVTGTFNDRKIEEVVEAVSVRQARLKGAFNSGLGGADIKRFMDSSSIKVKKL